MGKESARVAGRRKVGNCTEGEALMRLNEEPEGDNEAPNPQPLSLL